MECWKNVGIGNVNVGISSHAVGRCPPMSSVVVQPHFQSSQLWNGTRVYKQCTPRCTTVVHVYMYYICVHVSCTRVAVPLSSVTSNSNSNCVERGTSICSPSRILTFTLSFVNPSLSHSLSFSFSHLAKDLGILVFVHDRHVFHFRQSFQHGHVSLQKSMHGVPNQLSILAWRKNNVRTKALYCSFLQRTCERRWI